jgi:hypothetical protein
MKIPTKRASRSPTLKWQPLNIKPAEFHGEWNYTIALRQPDGWVMRFFRLRPYVSPPVAVEWNCQDESGLRRKHYVQPLGPAARPVAFAAPPYRSASFPRRCSPSLPSRL